MAPSVARETDDLFRPAVREAAGLSGDRERGRRLLLGAGARLDLGHDDWPGVQGATTMTVTFDFRGKGALVKSSGRSC
jgi:hypothetical protein